MILRRIEPFSAAKVSTVLYAAIGLVAGFFFSLFGLIGAALGGSNGAWGAMFGIGAIIMLPIFYGVLGFVCGLIGSFLYNLVAGWIGGIEMHFDDGPRQQMPQQPM